MSGRVLIVDDSILMRRMIADSLIDDGWEVAGEASDGQEAIQQYRQVPPDAVTMGLDGDVITATGRCPKRGC